MQHPKKKETRGIIKRHVTMTEDQRGVRIHHNDLFATRSRFSSTSGGVTNRPEAGAEPRRVALLATAVERDLSVRTHCL